MSWLLKPLGLALVSALALGVTFGMGDWHGRSIQRAKDMDIVNAAIDAKNKQIVADNGAIDQAHAEAKAARDKAADVVISRPEPIASTCKIDASVVPTLAAIH